MGQEVKMLSPREGTWQATATVSYQDSKEKSILLYEEGDDGGSMGSMQFTHFSDR